MANLLSERYLLTTPLGEGGFSSVFKATDTRLDREVAVKILKPDLSTQEGMIERFMREAKLTASLKHTHSLQIFDYGHSEDQLYIVSELLNGQTLDEIIKEQGSLSEAWICDYFVPLCMALNEAHETGIIHRDLKPSNLFLHSWGQDTRLIVIDFGISKDEANEVRKVTKTGQIFGTPHYMSPEQIQKPDQLEPSSDLYSLGIILFELINGLPPFNADTMFQLLSEHIKTEPPFLRDVSTDCSFAFATLVQELLAKNPADRPQSALNVAQRLQVLQTHSSNSTDLHFATPIDHGDSNLNALTEGSPATSPTLGLEQRRQTPESTINSQISKGESTGSKRLSLIVLGLITMLILIAVGSYFSLSSPPPADLKKSAIQTKLSEQDLSEVSDPTSSISIPPKLEPKEKTVGSEPSQIEAVLIEKGGEKKLPKKEAQPKLKTRVLQDRKQARASKSVQSVPKKRRSRRIKKDRNNKVQAKTKVVSKSKTTAITILKTKRPTKRRSISPARQKKTQIKATSISVDRKRQETPLNPKQPKPNKANLNRTSQFSLEAKTKLNANKSKATTQAAQKKPSELRPKASSAEPEGKSNTQNPTSPPEVTLPKPAPRPPVGF